MKYRIRHSLQNYHSIGYLHGDEGITCADVIDCSLGINPLGFSPRITQEVFLEAYDRIYAYPDYPYEGLRRCICQYMESVATITPEQVRFYGGSMGAIWNINKLLIDEKTCILTFIPGFSSTLSDMRSLGGTIDAVPLTEKDRFLIDIDQLIYHLKPQHHLVYLDNPNNPTGQVIPIEALRRLAHKALAQDTYVLIDEAYGEFMPLENSAVTLIAEYPNVLVVKSFSKGFGLAGLRTGYVVMHPDFIPYMSHYPGEMTVNGIASVILPVALSDMEHLAWSRQIMAENKRQIINSLTELNVSVTDGETPILLLYTSQTLDLYQLLLSQGIKTERGEDFDGLGKAYVRLRIPATVTECITRLGRMQTLLANDNR